MIQLCERSAVFVGCARNCGAHVVSVLANIERMAALYRQAAFVFVENDSQDDTKARLLHWLEPRPTGTLLELDGLAVTEPSRTARLATARNAYLRQVRESPYRDYDDLIVLDFDDVNAPALDMNAFKAAAEYLHSSEGTLGVFANSSPVYFDIWALRHPVWCPGDCWADIRALRHLPPAAAVERLLYARQIAINPRQPPFAVQSAFGGLGLYRLAQLLPQRYVGSNPDGTEVCEHVSVNLALSRLGQLFIYPALQNCAPEFHLRPKRMPALQLELEQDGARCTLLAPLDYTLEADRAAHPWLGRRLPRLSRLLAVLAPAATMIDVDAGIGDTVALCRLAGNTAPFVALEATELYFSFLEANRQASPAVFKDVRTMRATIRELGELQLEEVSLLRTGAKARDGKLLCASVPFLRRCAPVIWAQAAAGDATERGHWRQFCVDLTARYVRMCLFDSHGCLLGQGAISEQTDRFLELLRGAEEHLQQGTSENGSAPGQYLEVAFFPVGREDVYQTFAATLTEANR
jgi:hypothetical protein